MQLYCHSPVNHFALRTERIQFVDPFDSIVFFAFLRNTTPKRRNAFPVYRNRLGHCFAGKNYSEAL